jgi:hypothetical protein
MTIHVRVDHMLAAVSGEPVPSRGTTSRRSSSSDSQVIVMPAAVVPPKLMDMVVDAYVIHVLSTLSRKYIPRCELPLRDQSRNSTIVQPIRVEPAINLNDANSSPDRL